jgi:3-deoxy-D-manno-octulosonic-acid transferase
MKGAALFHPKAKAWVKGRRGLLTQLERSIGKDDRVIWMHVASLGEFEQGRPLLEKIKRTYPTYRILLTFFSPSGYEVRKNYSGADWVFYLPMDGPKNAKRFLDIVHPSLVIFVKYEFWYFYLKKINYRKIPLLLVSALFREEMSFFKWHGAISRKMLSRFDHLFVQNESSLALIEKIGLRHQASISGDTRFDRVLELSSQRLPITSIDQFKGDAPLLVAGSTWPGDEKVIAKALQDKRLATLKVVIAPHEINSTRLKELQSLFPSAQLLSSFKNNPTSNIVIIDSIGLLSSSYQYATFALIGGGFKEPGIHNTLEAAVYGIPVFFGPNYKKFAEAIELVSVGGAYPLDDGNTSGQLANQLHFFLINSNKREEAGHAAHHYVQSNKGASEIILKYIQTKQLLT